MDISLTKYFRTFRDIFNQWNEHEDIAIGGLWALRLHGLVVRDTNDLDIIVYQPSQAFIDFIVKEFNHTRRQ